MNRTDQQTGTSEQKAGRVEPASDGSASEKRPPEVKVVDKRWWAREDAAPGEGDWTPGKPTYLEELEKQLAEKDQLLQANVVKYREAAREFESARARLRKEVAKEVEQGRRAFLVELLEVVDNLDRAIEAAQERANLDALLQGVGLVRDQFLAKLGGLGISRIDAMNQPFDPRRHEAIATLPVTDPAQDGAVVGVIRPGYIIGDEVLRPAMVAVAKSSTEA